jgi:hypothetical protein
MPMTPADGENQKDFMTRCMDHNLNEKERDQDQSVAICLSQWRGKADGVENHIPHQEESRQSFVLQTAQKIKQEKPDLSLADAAVMASKMWDDAKEYREKADRMFLRDGKGKFATRAQIMGHPSAAPADASAKKEPDTFLSNSFGVRSMRTETVIAGHYPTFDEKK